MGSMTLSFAPIDLGQRAAAVPIISGRPRSAHASAAARYRSAHASSRAPPSLTVLAAVAATKTPIPALADVKPIFLAGSGAVHSLGTLVVLRASDSTS